MPPWCNHSNGFVISIPLFRMVSSEVRMIFKHCSLITFNRYDQTITMVASRGHVKSLNLGIKITKNWLFSLSECAHLHAKTKKRSKICSFLPWDHAKVQKNGMIFGVFSIPNPKVLIFPILQEKILTKNLQLWTFFIAVVQTVFRLFFTCFERFYYQDSDRIDAISHFFLKQQIQ